MSDLPDARIPKKYIGYVLTICGILFIIISINTIPRFTGFIILLVLGQICLVIGIIGIYYKKTKNYGSDRKSEEKEGLEQNSLTGINRRFLLEKNVFYLITLIGLIFTTLYYIIAVFRSYLINYLISKLPGVLFMMIFGYFFLISGLLVVYYNKKIANKV